MHQNVVMPKKSVDIFNFRVQCGFGDDSYKYCSNFPFNSSKYAHTTFKELKYYSFVALDIMLNQYIVLFSKKADNIGLIQCCLRF